MVYFIACILIPYIIMKCFNSVFKYVSTKNILLFHFHIPKPHVHVLSYLILV